MSGGGSITSPRYAPPPPPPRPDRQTLACPAGQTSSMVSRTPLASHGSLSLDIRFQYPREKNDKSGLPGRQLASLHEDWKHIRYLLCL